MGTLAVLAAGWGAWPGRSQGAVMLLTSGSAWPPEHSQDRRARFPAASAGDNRRGRTEWKAAAGRFGALKARTEKRCRLGGEASEGSAGSEGGAEGQDSGGPATSADHRRQTNLRTAVTHLHF